MEDDGFQLVSRKKAARASKVHTHNAQGEYDGMDGVELTKRIDKLKYKQLCCSCAAVHTCFKVGVDCHKVLQRYSQ